MIEKALPLAKYIGIKKVNIYDAVFILHSKCTVVILLTFTLLLTGKQFFGETIHCMTDLKFKEFVDSYCLAIGTFLIPSAFEQSRRTISVGVGNPTYKTKNSYAIEMVSLRYYQWIAVVLLLESVFFYFPAHLWKRWEGRRMEQLCSPAAEALISNKDRAKHCHQLVSYFKSNNRLLHGNYVKKYVTCDLLNLIVSVNIYDAVFILHSKCTVVILLTFTLLLTGKQFFGETIHCMTDLKFKEFVDSYCLAIGTFLIPSAFEQSRRTISVGVGNPTYKTKNSYAIEMVSLRYYQWIAVVLLLESVFFYFPAHLWKRWEGRRMEQLCSPAAEALISNKDRAKHCHQLVSYFKSDNRLLHGNYVKKYVSCDLLNLIVSICNIFFLEYLLNGFWSIYIDALSTLSLNNLFVWDNKVSQIFPKLAKCTIYTYGLGGSINNHDALCMLPLNVFNEKIFGFLWIWYAVIFLLASLKMLYHLCILTSSSLRAHLLRLRVRSIPYFRICQILNKRTIGDWFVLYKVSLNVNSLFFRDLLLELNSCLRHNEGQII